MLSVYEPISGSKFSKSGSSKNSIIVMDKPSHIFLIVDIVGFLLFPNLILFNVDCVIPHVVLRPFKVISFVLHNCKIRLQLASPIVINIAPLYYLFYLDILQKVNYIGLLCCFCLLFISI